MLSPLARIAALARKKRLQLKLSQRVLARKLGCSQPYIAQVETGRRPISRRFAERLETAFGVKPGSYTKVTFLRGRPALTEQSREALRLIRRASGQPAPPPRPMLKPRYPRPGRVSGLRNPFWPIPPHLGPEVADDIEELERLRHRDERFWRNLNGIPFDSWSEKRLLARVALTGVQLTGVSPARLGCQLQCVDGNTGRDSSLHARPAFLLTHGDTAVAWLTQPCVRTASGHRWPDNMLIVARGGTRVTALVEVQGAEFHSDFVKERHRTRELGVSILIVDAAKVGSPGLIRSILEWACNLIPPTTSALTPDEQGVSAGAELV